MDKALPDPESLAQVLRLIRTGAALGRPELQRVSGLGRSIVTERVNQLQRSSLVVEGDLQPSTGGRAARGLRLNAEAGLVLVCYADLTAFDVGVADLSGRLLATRHEQCEFDAGPEEMTSRSKTLWNEMLSDLGPGRPSVWGVGIGIPAHIDFASGMLIDSPSLPANWHGCDLRTELSAAFKAPVWIDTDDNLLVVGELRNGAARGEKDVVYLFVDMAIGSGLILGGQLYRGAQGAAGNIGHITSGGDAVCRCGRRGCVEAVAGGEALVRQATEYASHEPKSFLGKVLAAKRTITIADLREGIRQGDPFVCDMIAGAGVVLGRALASTVNILNPSLVIVGGRLVQTGDLFLSSLKGSLLHHSLPFVTRELRITPVERTEHAGLTGAAHMVIDQLFSPSVLGDWFGSGSPAGIRQVAARV